MIHIPMKSTAPFNKHTVASINQIKVQEANSLSNITNINKVSSAKVNNQNSVKQHSSSTTVRPINSTAQNKTQPIPSNPIVPNRSIPSLIDRKSVV